MTDQLGIEVGSVLDQLQVNHNSEPEQQEVHNMGKMKIEHGVSRIRRTKLQSSIDQSIASDIELMAQWSDNETNYIVNELLRFALTQEEDFLKHKAGLAATPARFTGNPKPTPAQAKPVPEAPAKPEPT